MLDRCSTADPQLAEILRRHPKVREVGEGSQPGIDFVAGTWERSVRVGDTQSPVRGLVELMDNNPLVCADCASVPPPISTLALIAFGPLAWAGLLIEAPSLIVSRAPVEENPADWLETAGWSGGLDVHVEERDLGTVIAATGMASIATPSDWTDIDALYEERYGRSFFVRRDETSTWDTALVAGNPHSVYRLRYTPDEPSSLLTIMVLADIHGKCGQAQIVHALNVMAGFEESLPFSV